MKRGKEREEVVEGNMEGGRKVGEKWEGEAYVEREREGERGRGRDRKRGREREREREIGGH